MPLALLSAVGLLLGANLAQAAELQWGHAPESRPLTESTSLQFRHASSPRQTTITQVVTVAWEEDMPNVVTPASEFHSILVGRPDLPQYMAQLPDDPFADVDEDFLPEVDAEEEPDENTEEPSDEEPAPNESSEDEDEDNEQLLDDLFGSDEEAAEEDTIETDETEAEANETPEPKETADDLFDPPSEDSHAEESFEKALEREIQHHTDEPHNLETLMEEDPLDSINTSDLFEKELGNGTTDESETSKLFENGPESFGLNIGGPVGSTELTEDERQQQLEQLAKERQQSEKNCEEEIAKTQADRINDINLSLQLEGNPGEDFPYECTAGHRQHLPRQWAQITYNWKASGLCHKPLYFEQVQLERYGHSWGPVFQPIMSGAHFFGTLPVLPYKMGIRTPTECVYTLGYYRPGNCAPYMIEAVPFTWRAALFQGGVATGLSFAIP